MKIVIGTAQFGLDYGLPLSNKEISSTRINKILDYFLSEGGSFIDTAFAYGSAQKKIGLYKYKQKLNIVTKLSCPKSDYINNQTISKMQLHFENSLKSLKKENVYGILLHDCDDLLKKNGQMLFDYLLNLKKKGFTQKIGVSVYTKDQIDHVLKLYDFDIIQIPINIYDQRLVKGRFLEYMKSKNIEIHARSIFLQGLLLIPIEEWPPYFKGLVKHHTKISNYLMNKNISILQACINFVFSIKEIDKIIVGINSLSQLREILAVLKQEPCKINFNQFSINQEKFTNPNLWPKNK